MQILTKLFSRGARICAALLFGLSLLSSTAQAQDRTCVCNVSCNGVSFNTSSNGPNGYYITTPMREQCRDKCNNWVNQNISTWAKELGKKACNSLQCAGSSKLSTGDSIGVGPFNLDTSSYPACKSDPSGNACCPEFTKVITPGNLASMFTEGAHDLGQPYTMTFSSNGAFSNAFENYLKEWAHWLTLDGCRGVTGFKINYQLFNTNSATKPTGPNPPAGSTGPTLSQTVSYVGTNVSPANFVWNIPASPNWWFVKATVTPIGDDGQAVQCAKTTGCFDRLYTGWIDDAITIMKTKPGAKPTTTIRILD